MILLTHSIYSMFLYLGGSLLNNFTNRKQNYHIVKFCYTGSSDYFHDTTARPLLSSVLSVCPPTPPAGCSAHIVKVTTPIKLS